MITILYSDTIRISNDEINHYIDLLPSSMNQEIMRYMYSIDQKSRLLARLMLKYCLLIDGVPELINQVQRDGNNKPFIEGWNSFNISHSGDLVVLAKAADSYAVGIDIEMQTDVDFRDVMLSFHPDEQTFIHSSPDSKLAFFEVWVKKEAFLKATGLGIVHNLTEFNCLGDTISYNGAWHFYSLEIRPGYISFVCSQEEQNSINIKAFHPEELAMGSVQRAKYG